MPNIQTLHDDALSRCVVLRVTCQLGSMIKCFVVRREPQPVLGAPRRESLLVWFKSELPAGFEYMPGDEIALRVTADYNTAPFNEHPQLA